MLFLRTSSARIFALMSFAVYNVFPPPVEDLPLDQGPSFPESIAKDGRCLLPHLAYTSHFFPSPLIPAEGAFSREVFSLILENPYFPLPRIALRAFSVLSDDLRVRMGVSKELYFLLMTLAWSALVSPSKYPHEHRSFLSGKSSSLEDYLFSFFEVEAVPPPLEAPLLVPSVSEHVSVRFSSFFCPF